MPETRLQPNGLNATAKDNDNIGELFDTIKHGKIRDQYDAICDTCDQQLHINCSIMIWESADGKKSRCICMNCHYEDEPMYRRKGWTEQGDDE